MNIIKNTTVFALLLTFLVAPLYTQAASVNFKEFNNGKNAAKYNDKGNTNIVEVITRIITFLLTFLAALAVLIILVAGVMYITSGGDEGKVETAKNWILYAIIGLIIALLGWVIVNIVSGAVVG